MLESSVLMEAGNICVLGSRFDNALTCVQSWGGVWKSLSPGFKRMPWFQIPALGLSMGDGSVPG